MDIIKKIKKNIQFGAFIHALPFKKLKKNENLKKIKNRFSCIHACIFKGINSTCKHLYMQSQNLLCIFLEFRTLYMHSQKFHSYMHFQKK